MDEHRNEESHWKLPQTENEPLIITDRDDTTEEELAVPIDSASESAEVKAKRAVDEIRQRILENQPEEK